MSAAPAPAPLPETAMPDADARKPAPLGRHARRGRFMLQHCASCGKVRNYPRPVCPQLLLDGKRVFSRSAARTARHALDGVATIVQFLLQGTAPYIGGRWSDMDAGVRMNAPLRGVRCRGLNSGQKVRLQSSSQRAKR